MNMRTFLPRAINSSGGQAWETISVQASGMIHGATGAIVSAMETSEATSKGTLNTAE